MTKLPIFGGAANPYLSILFSASIPSGLHREPKGETPDHAPIRRGGVSLFHFGMHRGAVCHARSAMSELASVLGV